MNLPVLLLLSSLTVFSDATIVSHTKQKLRATPIEIHNLLASGAKANSTRLNEADPIIDFVYCWAGEKEQQKTTEGNITADSRRTANIMGTGFSEMRLSLHTLQVNVPWLNKVYILVNGPQNLPAWAANEPRFVMVDRCSLFPAASRKSCPTFNSHACMSVVHRVPGLSEHFVYMEDDMFIVKPLLKSDLFSPEGKPYMTAHVLSYEVKYLYSPMDPGPDMPPDHLPGRIDLFRHMPVPLTISFAKGLETTYSEFFAFVRSHTSPFMCCDASTFHYGTSEDFTRIWPAMLFEQGAGVNAGLDRCAECWCHEGVSVFAVEQCVHKYLTEPWPSNAPGPGKSSLNVNSCDPAENWKKARSMIVNHLAQYSQHHDTDKARLVPVMLMHLQRGVSGMLQYTVCTADCMLGLCASWVIFSTWRSAGLAPAGFLGLTTIPQFMILAGYIFLSVIHMFLQRHSGATGYSVIAATILIYLGKSVVSFVMFLCRSNVRESFSALFAPGSERSGRTPAILLPLIPGGLLGCYDTLSFLSLHRLDPATYQVLVHTRIIAVCLLWQWVFKFKLSGTQWLSIVIFLAAGITKSIDTLKTEHGGDFTGIQIVIVQTLIGALANVSTEVLLKEMPIPTDLVNTCTYSWGLIWLLIAILWNQGPNALYSELLSPAAWARLQADPYMMGSIVSLICLGITAAYLLKMLSNIVKELSGGMVIIITCVVQMVTTTLGILGCIMAVLGIGVYSTDPHRYDSKKPCLPSSPAKSFDMPDTESAISGKEAEETPSTQAVDHKKRGDEASSRSTSSGSSSRRSRGETSSHEGISSRG